MQFATLITNGLWLITRALRNASQRGSKVLLEAMARREHFHFRTFCPPEADKQRTSDYGPPEPTADIRAPQSQESNKEQPSTARCGRGCGGRHWPLFALQNSSKHSAYVSGRGVSKASHPCQGIDTISSLSHLRLSSCTHMFDYTGASARHVI